MSNRPHRIVFINQNAGYLMIDIINSVADEYDEVVLITGNLVQRDTPLHAKVKRDSIIKYDRSTKLKRLWTWFYGTMQITLKVLFKYRSAELFIVSNPPMNVVVPVITRNKFRYLVYDIYPDALVEFKMLSGSSAIVKGWEKLNKMAYRRAAAVFTLTEGMRKQLSKYLPYEQIKVVPIWTDDKFLKPVAKGDNPFVQQHGLQDKFIVMYSGNLGASHNVEVIVDIAAQVKDEDILFLIIGEGEKKALLQERVQREQLVNCMFLPWQSTDVLPFSLAAADLAIVSTSKEASHLSVPSKTYNLMSVNCPILGIAPPSAELHQLIHEFSIGECYETTQVSRMRDFIVQLKGDKVMQQSMKSNLAAASAHFGPQNVKLFEIGK